MSKRRASFSPGQGTDKKGSGTMMVRADSIKRVQHRPGIAPAVDDDDEDDEPIAAGALGPGRGLPGSSNAPTPAPEQPPDPPDDRRPVVPGGPSPFSGYAPTADELAKAAAAGAESSNQVAAIVLGMGFVISVMTVLVLILIGIGIFAWTQTQPDDGLADADDDGKGHIRDTAVGVIATPAPKKGGGSSKPADPDDPDAPDAPPAPPTTGPISISVPEGVFFHTLEINCPDAQIRRRAKFRGRTAKTDGVPITEDCMVTFQGSQPAKTFIRGGEHKECVTFNPTECRLK